MTKTITAFIFSLLFALLTLAPNVMMMIDKNCDISVLIDSNEEEKQGEEKVKDFEVEFLYKAIVNSCVYEYNTITVDNSQANTYNYLHNDLSSPPPEHIL